MILLWSLMTMLQCILMLLVPSIIIYYYTKLWYFCFHSNIFRNCILNINIIKADVVWHKSKNQFVIYPCLEIRFIIFCVEIYHSPFRLMTYPLTNTIPLDLQTRILHSLDLLLWLLQNQGIYRITSKQTVVKLTNKHSSL